MVRDRARGVYRVVLLFYRVNVRSHVVTLSTAPRRVTLAAGFCNSFGNFFGLHHHVDGRVNAQDDTYTARVSQVIGAIYHSPGGLCTYSFRFQLSGQGSSLGVLIYFFWNYTLKDGVAVIGAGMLRARLFRGLGYNVCLILVGLCDHFSTRKFISYSSTRRVYSINARYIPMTRDGFWVLTRFFAYCGSVYVMMLRDGEVF